MSALSDAASIGSPVARGLLYIKSEKKENEGRRVLSNFSRWVYWEQAVQKAVRICHLEQRQNPRHRTHPRSSARKEVTMP